MGIGDAGGLEAAAVQATSNLAGTEVRFVSNKMLSQQTGVVTWLRGIPQLLSYGYAGQDIPDEYLIRIEWRARNGDIFVIKAPMQEKITSSTENVWSPVAASGLIGQLERLFPGFTELFQVASTRSTANRYTTRRVWTGGSPLDFTLSLKFEATTDVYTEVRWPVYLLRLLSLPYISSSAQIDTAAVGRNIEKGNIELAASKVKQILQSSFLAPPGPNPFSMVDRSMWGLGRWETVDVYLGKVYQINNVVVKSVREETPVRLHRSGNPIGQVVTINFQTYEIMTREALHDMYFPNG